MATLRTLCPELRDRFLALLNSLAEAGDVCPRNREIAVRLGVAEYRVTQMFRLAVADGHIKCHGNGQCRRVEIVATGKITAERGYVGWKVARKSKPGRTPRDIPADVIDARHRLQSAGYVVHSAALYGGLADRWIAGRHKNLDDAELIELADKVKARELESN